MQNRIWAIIILIFFCANVYALAPSTPTFDYPAADAKTVYDERPWIKFKATSAAGNINLVHIQIGTTAGAADIADYTSTTYPLTFYPLPAASAASIKHRIPVACGVRTIYIRIQVAGASPGTTADPRAYSAWSGNRSMIIANPPWGTDASDAVVSAGSLVKATDFSTIRAAIDNLRAYYNLSAYDWTTGSGNATISSGVSIKAADMTNMRTAIATTTSYICYEVTGTNYSWTNTITGGSSLIKATDINELRRAVEGFE